MSVPASLCFWPGTLPRCVLRRSCRINGAIRHPRNQCVAGLMLNFARGRWHTQERYQSCVSDVLHQMCPKRVLLMRGSQRVVLSGSCSAGRAQRLRKRWICGPRSSPVRDNVYVSVHRAEAHASLNNRLMEEQVGCHIIQNIYHLNNIPAVPASVGTSPCRSYRRHNNPLPSVSVPHGSSCIRRRKRMSRSAFLQLFRTRIQGRSVRT